MLNERDKQRVIKWIELKKDIKRLSGFRKEAISQELEIDEDDLELFLKELADSNTYIQIKRIYRCSKCGSVIIAKSCDMCNSENYYIDTIYKYIK